MGGHAARQQVHQRNDRTVPEEIGGSLRPAFPEPAEGGGRGETIGEVIPYGHAFLQEYGLRQN